MLRLLADGTQVGIQPSKILCEAKTKSIGFSYPAPRVLIPEGQEIRKSDLEPLCPPRKRKHNLQRSFVLRCSEKGGKHSDGTEGIMSEKNAAASC